MLLFFYASNSIAQLKNRLHLEENLSYQKGYLKDYTRIFAGISQRWNGGAIASIYPYKGYKVYGIVVDLTEEQIDKLNSFEKGYTLEEKEIIIDKKIEKCLLYVKNNNYFKNIPHESYLIAINNMLNQVNRIDDRKIPIRCIQNKKLKLLGYWNINDGYILF